MALKHRRDAMHRAALRFVAMSTQTGPTVAEVGGPADGGACERL
jgi:hypothetical protein